MLIQKRLLEQAGHTDYDQFYETGREDNSHLYRFTFLPTSSLAAFNRESKEKERASTPPDSRVKEGAPPSIHRSSEPTSPNVGRDQIEPWEDATQKRVFANMLREYTGEKAVHWIVDMGFSVDQAKEALEKTGSDDGLHVDRAVEYLLHGRARSGDDDQSEIHSGREQITKDEGEVATASASQSAAQVSQSSSQEPGESGTIGYPGGCSNCGVYVLKKGVCRWVCCQCGSDNSYDWNPRCTVCDHSIHDEQRKKG